MFRLHIPINYYLHSLTGHGAINICLESPTGIVILSMYVKVQAYSEHPMVITLCSKEQLLGHHMICLVSPLEKISLWPWVIQEPS